MDSITTFKFLVEENGAQSGDIRRVTLKSPVKIETLRAAAIDILGWPAVTFRFKDEDGDFVTVASQHELDTAIALASGNAVRFNVTKQEAVPVPVPVPVPQAAPQPAPEPVSEPVPQPAAAPIPEPVAVNSLPCSAPVVPPVSALDAAANATIPENVMVQFSVIAEFFQRMAQQMADFAPRIPGIVNEGIRKMSANMQNNFNPLEATVEAARADESHAAQPPIQSYGLVVHRLPECVVHPGIECAHCHKKPITGMRYKCVQCDCDLCQDCIILPDVHTEGHQFLPVCAPAVGSHFVQSASDACTDLKNRAAPVVENIRTAVGDAVESARQKVAEKVEGKEQPAPAITDKEREALQQLSDMGFTDQEKLLPLIRKHKDLSRVVQVLLS